MPNENLTEIVCLFDRSGSMRAIRNDAEGAFNAFIEEQKKVPGEVNITLIQFNTHYEVIWENKPIQEVPEFMLQPSGATALLDAMGKAINDVGRRLAALPEKDRPGSVIFTVITDGEENSSKEFKRSQIFEMVKHQTEKYNWLFVFLAANQDAIREASFIGIDASNAMNFAPTGQGVNAAMRQYSAGVAQYRLEPQAVGLNLPNHATETGRLSSDQPNMANTPCDAIEEK